VATAEAPARSKFLCTCVQAATEPHEHCRAQGASNGTLGAKGAKGKENVWALKGRRQVSTDFYFIDNRAHTLPSELGCMCNHVQYDKGLFCL
jgi:hypothetical protein